MFYERFYRMCQNAGVTPAKVADDLDLNKSTVYMWKKQGTTPKYQTLKKLEKYFGCDLTDLVSPEEGAQAIIEHIAVKAKSETPIERVTHDMVQMTDEGQSKVVGYVEDILPRYRRQDAPQTPPASSEGTDTTPPPDAPETPPEGE